MRSSGGAAETMAGALDEVFSREGDTLVRAQLDQVPQRLALPFDRHTLVVLLASLTALVVVPIGTAAALRVWSAAGSSWAPAGTPRIPPRVPPLDGVGTWGDVARVAAAQAPEPLVLGGRRRGAERRFADRVARHAYGLVQDGRFVTVPRPRRSSAE